MMCKVCDQEMKSLSICLNCQQYHMTYDTIGNKKVEFFIVDRFELSWWQDEKIVRIFIGSHLVKEFTISELTPELAKEWIEKLKSYNLMS